ncbi:MAG: transposase domain-containing protein, partial [Pseudonocardiaceae bacterium]
MAGGRFAPGHIGELTRIVPFEMVDAALAETGKTQARVRDLPSRVVVYLLLAAGLFAEIGYGQVWQADWDHGGHPDRRRARPGPPPARRRTAEGP